MIFDIQRFSIHDGPGIRTTVFLKGCPLGCQWCHNPESRSPYTQLAFYKAKCIVCGRCYRACPHGAISMGETRVNRDQCVVCGACAEVCPTGALQIIGRTASVEEVVGVVVRDKPFYKTSGGGVTISGGEPTFQFEFTKCLLQAFKREGLHTAIETSGMTSWEHLSQIAPLVDLFLFDMKAVDAAKHVRFCGVENSVILKNAHRLAQTGAEIVFRTPIVPGVNDSDDDIRALGEFVLSLEGKPKVALMAYHKIGTGKYEAIGMDYKLHEVEAPEDIGHYCDKLRDMGVEIAE